jgi:hypothetical protein
MVKRIQKVSLSQLITECIVTIVITWIIYISIAQSTGSIDVLGTTLDVPAITAFYCIDIAIKSNEETYAVVHACEMSDGTEGHEANTTSSTLHTSVQSNNDVLTVQIWDTTPKGLSRSYSVSSNNGTGVNVVSHKLSKLNYHELTFVLRSN